MGISATQDYSTAKCDWPSVPEFLRQRIDSSPSQTPSSPSFPALSCSSLKTPHAGKSSGFLGISTSRSQTRGRAKKFLLLLDPDFPLESKARIYWWERGQRAGGRGLS